MIDYKYDEPVFRPPAEAYSAIIQVTIGCSWNKCAFCEMYSSKQFRIKKVEDLKQEIEFLSKIFVGTRKVFLADGNAFVLSFDKLVSVLKEINGKFNRLQRISAYALPKDIICKTETELKELRALGLRLLYIGIETGDDNLLHLINKGETYSSILDGILKAQDAGIETSIMIINGLGGAKYSYQHAVNSAKIINQINPKYLSTLTLSFPFGQEHFKKRFKGEYVPQTVIELFEELRLFLSLTELNNVIYRSNHVSNNLILKGVLSKDKEKLINQIERAIMETPKGIYPSSPLVL